MRCGARNCASSRSRISGTPAKACACQAKAASGATAVASRHPRAHSQYLDATGHGEGLNGLVPADPQQTAKCRRAETRPRNPCLNRLTTPAELKAEGPGIASGLARLAAPSSRAWGGKNRARRARSTFERGIIFFFSAPVETVTEDV
jgi:hypothetical protein